LRGAHILVADDHPGNQALCTALIEEPGGRVSVVSNGQQVLEFLTHVRCDLILMDLHMPLLSGEEAARRIRLLEGEAREIPIIALTADILPETRRAAREAGINAFLTKPLEEYTLMRLLTASLNGEDPGDLEPPPTILPVRPIDEPLPNRDDATALSVAGGRADLAERLLKQFVDELPEQIEALKTVLAEAHWAEMQKLAHKLKGAASICGAVALGSAAEQLESVLRRQPQPAREAPPPHLVEKLFEAAELFLRHVGGTA